MGLNKELVFTPKHLLFQVESVTGTTIAEENKGAIDRNFNINLKPLSMLIYFYEE